MFSLSTFDLTRLITLSLVFAWFILGLYLSFTTHYTDPVLAGQREEQLIASIRADAALLYPPSTHPFIEIATRREPTPSNTPMPPYLDDWTAALLMRDDKDRTVVLLSATDKTLLYGTGEKALRLLAPKVKEAAKQAEKEREWAKMREESGECEWRVHGGMEEFQMLGLEEGKGGGA